MSNIERYNPNGVYLAPREARRVSRQVGIQQSNRHIREISSDAETDVTIGKIQNATMATGSGMQAIVSVATAQTTLEQMAPSASGRLALLADGHALDVADTLQDLRHRLRRI